MLHSTRRLNMVIIRVQYFLIQLQITRSWGGNNFHERSCCDLDLQGSDPNVARDTSCQYCDQLCKMIVKSDFELQSYGPATILLKGHAVTLTFNVATQMLRVTHRLNMVIIYVKYF